MIRAAIALLSLTLFSCAPVSPTLPTVTLTAPSGERVTVAVEIADDPSEQQRGLMGRSHLSKNHGMLFVFREPRPLGFWMKETLIPLDILFFDAEGVFVSGAVMHPCTADPCPVTSSRGNALSALEVGAGFVETHGVGEGWRMTWSP